MDVLPFQALGICFAGYEVEYRFADLALIVIHLSGIDPVNRRCQQDLSGGESIVNIRFVACLRRTCYPWRSSR